MVAMDTIQTLVSPGYPDNYMNDLDCRWTIRSPTGTRVWFNLTDISLEDHVSDSNCIYDSLSVYNGEDHAIIGV